MRWARNPAQWALIDQAVVSGANFLVSIQVARALDARGLALYSLASATMLGLSSVHRSLISQPMNIRGATEDEAHRFWRYMAMVAIQWWMLPLVALTAALVGVFFFPGWWLITGMVVFLCAFCLQDIARRFYYSGQGIGKALPGDIVTYGGQLLALLALWLFDCVNIVNVFWAMSVPVVAGQWMMHRQICRDHPQPKPAGQATPHELLRDHWDLSKWIVLSQLVYIGASQLIPFQLATFATPQDVASYHAANTLMNALNIVRLTMGNYLPARAAAVLARGGRDGLRDYLLQLGWMWIGLSSIGFLVLLVSGESLIDLLFGGKYQGAKVILAAMAAIHLLSISSLITAAGAQVLQITRSIFTTNTVAMALAWLVGPPLISRFGLWGALASLAIGLLLPAAAQFIHLAQALRVKPRPQALS
jgi:O-antigen/teichoic acid export membrane protein